jgi:hypothetical protein
LKAGASVPVTLQFTAPVTVNGPAPELRLNDGALAPYTSGSGTSALTFTYTVAPATARARWTTPRARR